MRLAPEREPLRDLVRDDPNLCVELLAQWNVIDRATVDEATCVDPTVRQNVSPSLSADVVVLLQRAREARLVVIVEVQLEIDDDKNWSWPMYASSLRGFSLDSQARERIDACDNGDVLERWIARAVTAPSADAVFEDDGR
ncbi:MAG: hypothetical protein JNK05_15040 [Myxococcales bacterium]|nr:hypothetical protein [Myxococcales bacterium]